MDKERGRGTADRRDELVALLPNLRRFAYSLAGNVADADDLLQSTVERVLVRGLPAEAELLHWVMRVCRNLWIDEIRARKVRKPAAPGTEEEMADGTEGERRMLGKLALRDVEAAMQELPEEQRAVLMLVAVEGYSYRQAAAVLETPIGTVMSRLARARAALADRFGQRQA